MSYIAIPLAAMESHFKIEKACLEGEEACTKAKYLEWMGFAGGSCGRYHGFIYACARYIANCRRAIDGWLDGGGDIWNSLRGIRAW